MTRYRRHHGRRRHSKANWVGNVILVMAVIAAIIAVFSSKCGYSILPGGGDGFLYQRINDIQSRTVSEQDIRIVIDTTDVYVSEKKLSYMQENTEDLKKVLKNTLEEMLTDKSVVYFEYDNGDYSTYQTVKEVLDDLAINPVEIKNI